MRVSLTLYQKKRESRPSRPPLNEFNELSASGQPSRAVHPAPIGSGRGSLLAGRGHDGWAARDFGSANYRNLTEHAEQGLAGIRTHLARFASAPKRPLFQRPKEAASRSPSVGSTQLTSSDPERGHDEEPAISDESDFGDGDVLFQTNELSDVRDD